MVIIILFSFLAVACKKAKKSVGFCKWRRNRLYETCYVEYGECYCDPFCVHFDNCCTDVRGNYSYNTYDILLLIINYMTIAELIRYPTRDRDLITQISKVP